MFTESLSQISPGAVLTFFCPDVNVAISQLDQSCWPGSVKIKIVSKVWQKLPSHKNLLEDILHSMATAILGVWPEWYGENIAFNSTRSYTLDRDLFSSQKIRDLQATRQAICIPWLKAAVGFCQAGKLPIMNQRFSLAIQASQLAMAIDPDDLVVILAVCDRHPQENRLLSLARSATWLAQETRSRVAVLIWEGLADRRELDSITYQAAKLLPLYRRSIEETDEGERTTICPIRGRPHPLSPGEQLLYKKITQDAELKNLFSFNREVISIRRKRYLVDLLWSEGGVIVEVDGYRHHGNQFAFSEDRNRDYELLISGYIVLRLTHEEVIHDIEIAIEKIRDVVTFRREQRITKREVFK